MPNIIHALFCLQDWLADQDIKSTACPRHKLKYSYTTEITKLVFVSLGLGSILTLFIHRFFIREVILY